MKTKLAPLGLACALALAGCATSSNDRPLPTESVAMKKRPEIFSESSGAPAIKFDRETAEARHAREEAATAKRRADYLSAHPEIEPVLRDSIRDGFYVQGMTLAEVTATLGPLASDSSSGGEGPGITVYSQTDVMRTTLFFFRDGKLARWTTLNR